MEVKLKYRGREVTDADLVFIRTLIARHPAASRRSLSRLLCEAWNWRQPNGCLSDMVCRSFMLTLHRAGEIELPPVRQRTLNPLAARSRPLPAVDVDRSALRTSLAGLGVLELRPVRRTPAESLFNSLLQEHHYLGYSRPVGEHLKYLVYAGDRPLACFAWSSPALQLGPRDRFIGWSDEARQQHLRFLAYNTRFLILPWVEVPRLASHLLSRMARQLPADWQRVYGHSLYFLETFVDLERFRGTAYRAANWISLGRTAGRGNNQWTRKRTRSVKEILGYPLTKRFRELLSHVQ